MFGAIFGLGPLELIIIIAVIVLLFAPAILPKLVRRAGDSVKAMREMTDNFQDEKGDGKEAEPKAEAKKKKE